MRREGEGEGREEGSVGGGRGGQRNLSQSPLFAGGPYRVSSNFPFSLTLGSFTAVAVIQPFV